MGRETRKRPEVALTDQERLQLSIARETVASLSEREPAPEALTELGYEQRQARGRALELAVSGNFGRDSAGAVSAANRFYDFIWEGKPDAAV